MEGWIKLHRKSFDHWLYKTKKPKTRREAWEDILMLVNYEDNKVLIRGQLYECLRGQSLMSLDSWAKQFNWSKQQVRTFFSILENDTMIKLEGLQYTTRLTVCNYEIYQQSVTHEQHTNNTQNNTPLTHGQHTANTPLTSTKEDKKEKKVKKERIKKEFIPPTLDEVRLYFIENGYKPEVGEKMFKSYSVANWIDSKGNKVNNWKQKAINVWFTDDNRKKPVPLSA